MLVVHALDRLGRSLPHLVKIITTCVEREITLISYRENIDLSTSTGRMLAGMFSVLAEYEFEGDKMIRSMHVHQMVASLTFGDAIGNEALRIQSVLRSHGVESEIFAESTDSVMSGRAIIWRSE